MKIGEDMTEETNLTVQEDTEDMKKIEKAAKDGQQRPANMKTETMKIRKEEKKMIRKDQEAHHPEEGDIGKIARTKTMITRKEEVGEEEGVAHQTQEIEEEIPAIINEGDAQGP